MRHSYAIMVCVMVLPAVALCRQEHTDDNKVIQLPDKLFGQISKAARGIQDRLERQTARYIDKIMRQEQRLKRRVAKKDSAAASELFGDTVKYRQLLQQVLNSTSGSPPYMPYLDTLHTSLRFLQQHPQLLSNAREITSQAQAGMEQIQALESHLQKADAIKQILRQREQYLRDKLQNLGFAKAINKLNRQVHYYGQQVNEYKELLKHPGKIERKAIDLLNNTKVFQDFMRRNSRLASLFRLPGNDNNTFTGSAYAGLQTRAQVGNLIQQQIAAGGPNAQQQFQQQIQTAQAELGKLKDKLLRSPSTGGEADMPSFKPNTQKTKSFRQRLELGANLQSQKATNYFPVTTDIGLSLGYKINDKSVIGIGASYKMGWGQGWNHISITHQGAGIRSFVDWKLKGSFWLSGGFEMNYRTAFNSINELKSLTAWQQSGLMGLSKKYSAGKKFKGRMQLLWDFLSYQNRPITQPLIVRFGYSFK